MQPVAAPRSSPQEAQPRIYPNLPVCPSLYNVAIHSARSRAHGRAPHYETIRDDTQHLQSSQLSECSTEARRLPQVLPQHGMSIGPACAAFYATMPQDIWGLLQVPSMCDSHVGLSHVHVRRPPDFRSSKPRSALHRLPGLCRTPASSLTGQIHGVFPQAARSGVEFPAVRQDSQSPPNFHQVAS